MIARDHDHALNAQGPERGERRPRRGAGRIEQADHPEVARASPHHHQGPPLQAQLGDDGRRLIAEGGHAVRPEHLRLSDPDRLTAQFSGHALSREALEVGRGLKTRVAQSFGAVAHNRLRQRMVAEPLNGDGGGQKVGFPGPAHRHDLGDARPALGQGAGLVERDRIERAEVLQGCAALDQDAGARRARHTGQDGAGGGDGEGAGAGRDQHGHGPVEAVAERLVDHHPGEQQHEGQRQHQGHEDALEPVREALRRRLLRLGLTHHPHHLGQGGVAGHAGRLDLDGAGAVDGAREDQGRRSNLGRPGAGGGRVRDRLLVDRHALAGDRRLIDARRSFHDEAVRRKPFVRTNHHGVADPQILDRKFDDLSVTPDMGGSGCQFSQGLDRTPGPPHGVVFKGMADAEQEQQKGSLRPGAERRRARRGDEHEGVDLEPLLPEVLERFTDGEETAEAVGDKVERERAPVRNARRQFFEGEAQAQGSAGSQGENHLGVGTQNAPVAMFVAATRPFGMGFALRPRDILGRHSTVS